MYDLTLIYQYLYHKQARAGNYVIQLSNNISYREADALDHLEMIMAQTRLATVEEMSSELYKLLRMMRQ